MSKWKIGDLKVGERFSYRDMEGIVTNEDGYLVGAIILDGTLIQRTSGEKVVLENSTEVTKIDKYGIVIPKQSATCISFQEAVENILEGKSVKYTNNKGLSIEVGRITDFRSFLKVSDDFYDLAERGRWYTIE